MTVTEHWYWLPGDIEESPFLEIHKSHQNMALDRF